MPSEPRQGDERNREGGHKHATQQNEDGKKKREARNEKRNV